MTGRRHRATTTLDVPVVPVVPTVVALIAAAAAAATALTACTPTGTIPTPSPLPTIRAAP